MRRTAAGSPPRRRPLLALIVPAAIALAAVSGVVGALESGDYRRAIGPLLATLFAVFIFLRLVRRRP